MTRLLFIRASILLLTAFAAVSAEKDKKKTKTPKPPEVTILEAVARRGEVEMQIDGRVSNTGEKQIRGLLLLFDILAPGGSVLTTQQATIDEEVLDPGAEASFRVLLTTPARAVHFQINAMNNDKRELRVGNGGPFPIE